MSAAASSVLDVAFEKIDRDIAYVMTCLQEVLAGLGESDLAERLPWAQAPADSKAASSGFGVRDIKVLSIAFQLLNMVEENAAAQTRRLRETQEGMLREPGLWGQNLRQLRDAGVGAEQIAKVLPGIHVEPVLTAHPTEAKRSTVLEQHRLLYVLLVKRENQMWTPAEQQTIRDEFKLALERLWRTGEVYFAKPEVAAERRGVIHYLREVFPEVLSRLDLRLQQAWQEVGFDPALLEGPGRLPRLSFGNWVGGDRDGHDLVTAQVTAETLAEQARRRTHPGLAPAARKRRHTFCGHRGATGAVGQPHRHADARRTRRRRHHRHHHGAGGAADPERRPRARAQPLDHRTASPCTRRCPAASSCHGAPRCFWTTSSRKPAPVLKAPWPRAASSDPHP